MNKFYKTSFAFHQANRLASSKDLENNNLIGKKNQYLWKIHKQKETDHSKVNQQIKNAISKKIQIDPTMLFNHKIGVSKNTIYQHDEIDKKMSKKLGRMSQTSKQRFYQNNKRPESKKSSRVRLWTAQKGKDGKESHERPQTSKSLRRTAHTRQSHGDQGLNGLIRTNSSQNKTRGRPYSTAGRDASKQELQSSLDPQFLALFAQ